MTSTAEWFAKIMSDFHPGSTPVIFQVNVPVSKLADLKVDEIGHDMAAVRIEQNIPKEWIAGMVKEETKTMYVVAFVDGGDPATKSEGMLAPRTGPNMFRPKMKGQGRDTCKNWS